MKTTDPKKVTRHSLETKLEVIKLHEEGYGCATISKRLSIAKTLIPRWINLYRTYGISGLEKRKSVHHSGEFKAQIVREVLENSLSCEAVALKYNVGEKAVQAWKTKVLSDGYAALTIKLKRCKHPKDMGRPNKKIPQTDLEKLQEKILYLEAENAYLKKLGALVKERIARESGK